MKDAIRQQLAAFDLTWGNLKVVGINDGRNYRFTTYILTVDVHFLAGPTSVHKCAVFFSKEN